MDVSEVVSRPMRVVGLGLMLAISAGCNPHHNNGGGGQPIAPPPDAAPMVQSGFTLADATPLQIFHFDNEVTCNDGWDYSLDMEQVFHCGPVPAGLGPEQGVFRTRGALFATPSSAGQELNGAVTSPEILLPQNGPFYLALESWVDLEIDDAGHSAARVEVLSEDCDCDVVLEPAGGADEMRGDDAVITDGPTQRMWRRFLYDLSAFAGKRIRIRLSVASDSAMTETGWLVDMLEVGHGTLVQPTPNTSLGACEAGASVRFGFDACDEGFRQGLSSGPSASGNLWHCAPPSRDIECEVPDGPRFDSPSRAFDASGRLMATGPGQAYVPGQLSFLRAPPIDIAGCTEGRVLLSFWHDYHFAVGDGGVVQAFDGAEWQTITPIGGYPGVIRGTELGDDIAGFASDADAPSGWQQVSFDVTDFVPGPLYLRFGLASKLGRPSRPGWFLDTVEVSRAPELPPEGLALDRRQPSCGLDAVTDLASVDPAPNAPHDPCVDGVSLVAPRMLEALMQETQFPPIDHLPPPTDNPNPNVDLYQVNVPEDGALCLNVNAGDGGFMVTRGLRVSIDGALQPLDKVEDRGSLRVRVPVSAGLHQIAVGLDEGLLHYSTLFAAGSPGRLELPPAFPNGAPLSLSDVRITNDPTGRARIQGRVGLRFPQAQPGRGELAVGLRVTISRADRCRELRHLVITSTFDQGARVGPSDRVAQLDIPWDGKDDQGKRIRDGLPLVVTIDALPFQCDEDAACQPIGGGGSPGPLPPGTFTGPPAILDPADLSGITQRWSFLTDSFSWTDFCPGDGPHMSNCFVGGTYTDTMGLGSATNVSGVCEILVRDAAATGVQVDFEQAGTRHPATIVEGHPERNYVTIRVPENLTPDATALLHVSLDGAELANSPKLVNITGPSIGDLLDPGIVNPAGTIINRRSLLTDVSRSRIHAGETALATGMDLWPGVIAGLTGTLSDGVTGSLAFAEAPREAGTVSSGADMNVILPSTPVFLPGPPPVRTIITRLSTDTIFDRRILLKPPSVLQFQNDRGRVTDTFRRGDRVSVEGEGLRIAAYGSSLFTLDPMPLTTLTPAMIERDAYEITLPDTLALGEHLDRAEYGGVMSVVADGPPICIVGRPDAHATASGTSGFSVTRLADFQNFASTCVDSVSGDRWDVEVSAIPGTVPVEFNVNVGRSGESMVNVSQFTDGAFAGVRLVGRCNILLVSGRPVRPPPPPGEPAPPPDFRFKVHRRDLSTDRWTQVGGLPILKDVTASNDFITFVSEDGSIMIRNLWLDSNCSVLDGPSDSNLEVWDLGCARPRGALRGLGGMFNCACGCSAANWRIDVVMNTLTRLELEGRSDLGRFLPAGGHPFSRDCDLDICP